jgi:hypothetical protein
MERDTEKTIIEEIEDEDIFITFPSVEESALDYN